MPKTVSKQKTRSNVIPFPVPFRVKMPDSEAEWLDLNSLVEDPMFVRFTDDDGQVFSLGILDSNHRLCWRLEPANGEDYSEEVLTNLGKKE